MNVFTRRLTEALSQPPKRALAPARAGNRLTFRAELMPGRTRAERTFAVARVLENGRVEMHGLVGEHAPQEFELA